MYGVHLDIKPGLARVSANFGRALMAPPKCQKRKKAIDTKIFTEIACSWVGREGAKSGQRSLGAKVFTREILIFEFCSTPCQSGLKNLCVPKLLISSDN